DIPWASVKDLNGIELSETEDYITESGVENSATNVAPDNSVIISTRMTVGEPFLNNVDMAINQDMKAIIPNTERVNPLFLVYSLWDKDPYLKSLGRGTTVDGITTKDLLLTHLGLPSLEEQRKIASVLYNVDQLIEKTKMIIQQIEYIKRALNQDLFRVGITGEGKLRNPEDNPSEFKKTPLGYIPESWECVRLRSVIERSGGFIQTGPFGTQLHKEEYVDDGIPVVMPQNIENAKIIRDEIAEITPEKAEELARHRMEINDVIIARRGDLKRASSISGREEGWLCGTGCLLIRPPEDEIDGRWLQLAYQHPLSQHQINSRAVGSTMSNLNQSILENLQIALPPVEEQRKIIDIVSDINSRIESERNYSERLNKLKQGLMQDLLSGEVRTHDKGIEL
ncbi:MAG: restriction endonuclease subunit S, partial [Halobacteriaceae archaeon]